MVAFNTKPLQRFELGKITGTPDALWAICRSDQNPTEFIDRHASGDWGDVNKGDWKLNDEAVAHEGDPDRQGRVLSVYKTKRSVTIWVITEADRSATTLLLPHEY